MLTLIIVTSTFSNCAWVENVDSNNSNQLLLKAGNINTETIEKSDNKTGNISQDFRTESFGENENYYIVQFTGPVREIWKENITEAGASIYNYLPNNAFVFE
ncbi:MAG: hypothetical protein R2741_09435 [Methanolobus sp.]